MKLSYRGVQYTTAQPSIEVVEAPTVGTYRGATYHIKRAAVASSQSRTQGLKYRGAVVR